jgi:hypothetical protein
MDNTTDDVIYWCRNGGKVTPAYLFSLPSVVARAMAAQRLRNLIERLLGNC